MIRRKFVQLGTAAAAAALTQQARPAESLPVLPTTNPQAVALRYAADVAATPPEGYPARSGQNCANCIHYRAVDAGFGTCALFPGYRVHAPGWCAGWVKQP